MIRSVHTENQGRTGIELDLTILLGCGLVVVNIGNVFAVRMGTAPDLVLLSAAILAFAWTLRNGLPIKRLAFPLAILGCFFVLYIAFSAYHMSYRGFRNAASIFTICSVFLFFFCASHRIRGSLAFAVTLLTGLASFFMLWVLPVGAAKNLINSLMCYYLIAAFLCLVPLRAIGLITMVPLFGAIFAISIINDHRTLAGLAAVVVLQYLVLSLNFATRLVRTMMFVGMLASSSAIVALLVNPNFSAVSNAINNAVTGTGERTIMSGRQAIWPAVWHAISTHPVLGLDPGASTGDLYRTSLSAHNLYLEIGLQLGYIGIALAILLFWSLWLLASASKSSHFRGLQNLLTVVITMVAVHSLFDVFLTQDSLAAGVPVWMVLGLGLGAIRPDSHPLRIEVVPATPTDLLNRTRLA